MTPERFLDLAPWYLNVFDCYSCKCVICNWQRLCFVYQWIGTKNWSSLVNSDTSVDSLTSWRHRFCFCLPTNEEIDRIHSQWFQSKSGYFRVVDVNDDYRGIDRPVVATTDHRFSKTRLRKQTKRDKQYNAYKSRQDCASRMAVWRLIWSRLINRGGKSCEMVPRILIDDTWLSLFIMPIEFDLSGS